MPAAPADDAVTFTVPSRFNGPPDSANGGYACGLFARLGAARHGRDVAVTLLAPPPLDIELEFHPAGRRSRIHHGDRLIATVTADTGELPVIGPVSGAAAAAASRAFTGGRGHPFPTCFVCGVDREEGDGLLLAPGPVPDLPDTVACRWTPGPSVTDGEGHAELPVLWGALDCPGGWTDDPAREPMVLSRMTARITERPRLGRPHVVVGRRMRRAGRTAVNATALYTEDGHLIAHASAVWAAVNDTSTSGALRVHS
ncbi:hypothetical protein AF335_14995 [Streptomyces eurocidicus]|uniref:Uncharacterized protein n=1 Tax=Streptomyces eurocidicus TaxID=66423 RepID=A0A2N8NVP9_STREU|nr:hypothetical protein [Streptomyces eurocidicus]MBB5123148.1 hypothetical protein [Streptomyces eurocidicus]MBF6056663.1 hypothetical protein [Streptomyces eurocidicus]PNE32841.1 hypothetical protein AF335_14995 [Streptomyces eurocidicus]